ncbi:ABC transporter substrate-binding protein [Streptomyces scopuliridis]|uniref:ABC transporter substrate-binding protein n=1 Tax=Streptomyces scopuliridis TaxID=452529 RepID=A0ACD4ZCG2_9ACTN|nr:ABC transporter substrate-binding protein [Streptomyces scopuliridis]WSB31746.1 ABC transporter substrate-binding protein [Streptomyces scopuliridis]WSB95993.1 ABC transporter substrate-binding protein [Streptomyces scopuliridis]WSC10300.1 ABC transporter substrate-binding protein [Streptomyces scopuliridis]
MRTRTPVAILVATAALTVLGGCSPSSSDAGAGSGQKVTLTVAEWTNPGAVEFTKELNAKFEKAHPGVTVTLQTAPTANAAWQQLWNSMLQSKSVDVLAQFAPTQQGFAPDYTNLKPGGSSALVASGQLTDLKDQPFMKKYDPEVQAAAVGYQGGVYGVMAAQYVGAGGLWYKKDLLAKHGLSVPTTYQEFLDACEKLKKAGITPIFVSAKDGMHGGVWQGIANQMIMKGRQPSESVKVSEDRARAFWKGTQSWTDPVYREISERHTKIMEYVEPNASGVSQQTAPGVWATQADNYPFLLDGSWDGLTIQQANPKLNLGFFTLPGTDDPAANRVAFKPDLTWVVPASSRHKDLAMEWLAMFSEPGNYKKWLEKTGSLSTQTAVRNTELPWMDWLNTHMGDAFPQLSDPWTPAGAPIDAKGPDLYKMTPIGGDSIDTILSRSASAYRKSVGR